MLILVLPHSQTLALSPSAYLWHIVHQQEGNTDGRDVVGTANLEDVSEPHDGRVPSSDISWFHVVIHTKVESDMYFWEVRVPRDVKFSCEQQITITTFRNTKHVY